MNNLPVSVDEVINTFNVTRQIAIKYLEYLDKTVAKIRRGGRSSYKDSSKSKTYNAEYQYEKIVGSGKSFNSIDEAQAYANEFTKSYVYQTNLGTSNPAKIVYVSYMKSKQYRGLCSNYKIQLSDSGLNEYTLLHELVHAAGHRHHDVSFRKCLLEYIKAKIGAKEARILKEAFKLEGLKLTTRKVNTDFNIWYKRYLNLENTRKFKNNEITNFNC